MTDLCHSVSTRRIVICHHENGPANVNPDQKEDGGKEGRIRVPNTIWVYCVLEYNKHLLKTSIILYKGAFICRRPLIAE